MDREAREARAWIERTDWERRYESQRRTRRRRKGYRFVKRAFDILASALGLLVLLIPFLIIAIWIRIDTGGSAFFLQTRYGRDGKTFKMVKFRTMIPGSENLSEKHLTMWNDPRITRSGAFLRRTKLDEMPQLFNVFVGQMSLVGSRPMVKYYVRHYEPQYRVLLLDRPGITDLASLTFRNEQELLAQVDDSYAYFLEELMPMKLKYSLEYQAEATFWKDLKLIFRTVFT